MNALNSIMMGANLRQGFRDRNERRKQRTALEEIGGLVADGDRTGARQQALRTGNFQLAQQIAQMPDEQRQAVARSNEAVARVAATLQSMPYEQRRAALQNGAFQDALLNAGFSKEQVVSFDPTDERIGLAINQVRELDEVLQGAGGGNRRLFKAVEGEDGRIHNVFADGSTEATDVRFHTPQKVVKSGDVPYFFGGPGQQPAPINDPTNLGQNQEAFQQEADAFDRGIDERRVAVSESAEGRQTVAAQRDRLRQEVRAETALGAAREKIENLSTRIDEAIEASRGGIGGNVGPNSLFSGIPGTSASNFKHRLATLEANAAFDALQAMRDASPTGGALGQVTERELELLKASQAALNQAQTEEQFDAELQRFKQQIAKSLARVEAAYQQEFAAPQEAPFGVTPNGATPGINGPSPVQNNVDDLLQKYGVQ